MAQLTLADFTRMALASFGADADFRDDIEEWADLPYLQMGSFARLAERAKAAGDWDTYKCAIRLVDTLWESADAELKNALNVSFLEHIDFDGPQGAQAWRILTARLQRAWKAMAAYNEWVRSGAKGPPPDATDA